MAKSERLLIGQYPRMSLYDSVKIDSLAHERKCKQYLDKQQYLQHFVWTL